MKKLVISTAIGFLAVIAQAASYKWSARDIVGVDGTGTYNGTAMLQSLISGSWKDVNSATVTDGVVKLSETTFSDDIFVVGNDYDFRFLITEGDKTFTSGTQTVGAQMSDIASIKFGSQADVKWSGDVPEPTSGLLLLLGMAGLALRRKHA